MLTTTPLPIPTHFDSRRVAEVWRVPYEERAIAAAAWANEYGIAPASQDDVNICLLAIDVQNTFCIPSYELFVGGRSGMGAVEDNVRLCEFIYRNLARLTELVVTMDTHTAAQVFHAIAWVNEAGEHPPAMTMITRDDVERGVWRANPALGSRIFGGDAEQLQAYARHYVQQLESEGKFPLTIWPYHSMLGGVGHALVSAFEEACFFHAIARQQQTRFELKGSNPLTENYSVLKPEVMMDHHQRAIAHKNTGLIDTLLDFDAVVIAGQAKSHCVAWTVDDLLREIKARNPKLAQKVYLLEDCASPVVVPGVVDFTNQADAAYERFTTAGMHVVKSTEPMESWLKL
ncbi:isochorismatase [Leptolyngbya sp. AN02str]|uniref:isochorismatase n=1 Tax=Leptolyngbya sp. AN02str TaxID=3423363 RepID=UPI003D3243DA